MFKNKFTILSAELSTLSESENAKRTELLRQMLADIKVDFLEAKGCYKGSEEVSFIVDTPDIAVFNTVYSFAKKQFNQESVLYVDENQEATLMYSKDFEMEKLGVFGQVNPKRLETLDAYTVIDGTLYAVI